MTVYCVPDMANVIRLQRKGSLNFSERESVIETVNQVNQSLVCRVNKSPYSRDVG